MRPIKVPVEEIVKEIEVDVVVTGIHRFTFRLKLGLFFVRLGLRLAGLAAEIEIVESPPPTGLCPH